MHPRGHLIQSGRVGQEAAVRAVVFVGLLIAAACPFGADGAKDAAPKDPSQADLLAVQGRWERQEPSGSTNPYRRAVKEVKGQEEVVTYYKADGTVWRAHRAQFNLSRSGDVKVFTFSNVQIIDGDGKGTRIPQGRSYIYVATDKQFKEVSGFLPGQEAQPPGLLVWDRAKGDDKVAALPAHDPQLQGVWVPYHSEEGGADQLDQRNYLVKFQGNRIEVVRDGNLMLRGRFITYAAREPRRIDILMEQDVDNPENAGKTLKGIYSIKGDELHWCTGTTVAPQPPTEFITREGDPFLLVAMRRQKEGQG
jgi:uncharacterized protein (TIGR03067 family)